MSVGWEFNYEKEEVIDTLNNMVLDDQYFADLLGITVEDIVEDIEIHLEHDDSKFEDSIETAVNSKITGIYAIICFKENDEIKEERIELPLENMQVKRYDEDGKEVNSIKVLSGPYIETDDGNYIEFKLED